MLPSRKKILFKWKEKISILNLIPWIALLYTYVTLYTCIIPCDIKKGYVTKQCYIKLHKCSNEAKYLMKYLAVRHNAINPIRPAPVPQRHYHHKIVCQIYMNGLNGLSFHDFSNWILLCPLKKSNLQYLYKIFWKIKFWTYLVSLNFESKMEEFVKKLTYWVRMLTFFTCGLEFVHDRYQQA